MAGVHPETAFEVISKTENRLKWDTRIDKLTKLDEQGNEVIQHYTMASGRLPFVAQRDVLVRQQLLSHYPEAQSFCYTFTSITDDRCPEDPEGNIVRAKNHLTGYKFTYVPELNGTRMEWI